jgi:hypothetical protein
MNSDTVGIAAAGSRRPGAIGWTLRNLSPDQRGDALILSSRAPFALEPSDFMAPA